MGIPTPHRLKENKEGGLGAGVNHLSVHPVVFFGVWHGVTTYKDFSGLKTLRRLKETKEGREGGRYKK
jgi:hypothetical protein